jgi:hypothetical protein
VRHLRGNLESFFAEGSPLGERAQLGMAHGQMGSGMDSGQDSLPKTLAALRPVEGSHRLPDVVDGPTIVALGLVRDPEVEVRQRLEANIPAGGGECQGALGGDTSLVIHPRVAEIDRQGDGDLRQPTRIVEGYSQGFGLAQHRQETLQITGQMERCAQSEPEIDGLLLGGLRRWQMRENAERRLEIRHDLAAGRSRQSLVPGLSAVQQGLSPQLAA